MTIRFQCESCGQVLEVEDSYMGKTMQCPHCSNTVTAREQSQTTPPRDAPGQSQDTAPNEPNPTGNVPETQNIMFCPQCGERNKENNYRCVRCSFFLHGAPYPQPDQTSGGAGVESVIPYKNVNALIAYYLGVFSIMPCLGVLLAIPAIILGILGLVYAKKRPDAKGKIHAWVGILIGALSVIAHAGLIIWIMADIH